MKLLFLLLACTAVLGSDEFCSKSIKQSCRANLRLGDSPVACNASYSYAHHVLPSLHTYVHQHISHNFQYLLMSVNFKNYVQSREGFAKLYRKLADESWEDAISLIKYITKRGGVMNFDSTYEEPKNKMSNLHELESLGNALEMQKSLAKEAHIIHSKVTKPHYDHNDPSTNSNVDPKSRYHDAETISFLENEFVHKHADTIRTLAGHTNDLFKMINGTEDPSLSIYLFDEYLKSAV